MKELIDWLKNQKRIGIELGTTQLEIDVLQAVIDKAKALQLLQANVVGQSEQFYCNQDDGEYNNNPCSEQCRFCKDGESLQ
jgi:hypothetical protein